MSNELNHFQPRRKAEEYKRLAYLYNKAQEIADDCREQFCLSESEVAVLIQSIIGWIDLFEDCLINENALPHIVEARYLFGLPEQELLFVRNLALSGWKQIVQENIQHGFFSYDYHKSCDQKTLSQLHTTFEQFSTKKPEIYRLLKNRDIQNLITFFKNLSTPIYKLQKKIEAMLLESSYTEEEKMEHIARVGEMAKNIDQIINLITDHMQYTTIAQHEVKEISMQEKEAKAPNTIDT